MMIQNNTQQKGQLSTESFIYILHKSFAKILAIKIESFINFVTFFKILAKIKTLESTE